MILPRFCNRDDDGLFPAIWKGVVKPNLVVERERRKCSAVTGKFFNIELWI